MRHSNQTFVKQPCKISCDKTVPNKPVHDEVARSEVTHGIKKSVLQLTLSLALISSGYCAQAATSNESLDTQVIDSTNLNIKDNANYQNNQLLQSTSIVNRLINESNNKGLAEHTTWLRLHYYESVANVNTNTNSYDSKVDTAGFFISPNGKHDPQAELEATIAALVSQITHSKAQLQDENNNNSVICKFPARTHWLVQQLNVDSYLSQLNVSQTGSIDYNCPEYDAWIQKLDPQRLSVLFAEEYLDNPMSAFAHSLILIDNSQSLADPNAIDKAHSLNDTVDGDPDDGFLLYALKAMTGRYANEIIIEPFPQKLSYYLQQDERDVWTYPLVLSDEEIIQIMRHVWETKDLGVPYYFTKDNCASELLRYIDVVRPEGSLLEQFKLAIVPSDVIRLLHDEGLLVSQDYLPADDTLRQASLNNPNLTLPESSISENGKLNPTQLTPVDNNPLNAHGLKRIIAGAGQQGDTGYLSLGMRIGFNDLLDSASGYPENFDLEGLSATVRVYEDKEHTHSNQLELHDFTLIRGRSFNPINTAKGGSTWGANLQLTQVRDGSQQSEDGIDSNHLVGSFAYEKGVSYALGEPKQNSGQLPPHLCYALGTGLLQGGKGLNNGYRVGAGVNLGCRYQFGSSARIIGEMQLPYWYHGDIHTNDANSNDIRSHYWQPILSLGAQYDIDKNQAIRLLGSYEFSDRVEGEDTIQLSYINYF